ncbi:MAG: TlpA family protein disulfide reductase [Actinomycetota bacterium]
MSPKREDAPGASDKQARRRAALRTATSRKAQWGLAAALGIALLGFILFQEARNDSSVSGLGGSSPAAREIQLTDFAGERFALSDYTGTPVVLNFWASWCPNCVAEMPAFEQVHKDLEGKVAFVGVDQRDDRAAADDLARKTGVTYRLAEDPTGRVFDAFGGVGMPTTVFIDARGRISEVVTGQLSEEQLRGYISDMGV